MVDFVLSKEAAQQVLGMTREAAAGNATHMQIFVPMLQQLCECFITAHDEILRREQKLETLGEELKSQRDETNAAMERAAELLPEGYQVIVSLENGAGYAHWTDANGDRFNVDGAGSSLAEQIIEATDSAIAAEAAR